MRYCVSPHWSLLQENTKKRAGGKITREHEGKTKTPERKRLFSDAKWHTNVITGVSTIMSNLGKEGRGKEMMRLQTAGPRHGAGETAGPRHSAGETAGPRHGAAETAGPRHGAQARTHADVSTWSRSQSSLRKERGSNAPCSRTQLSAKKYFSPQFKLPPLCVYLLSSILEHTTSRN